MDKLRQKYLQKWLRAQQQPVKKLMRTNIALATLSSLNSCGANLFSCDIARQAHYATCRSRGTGSIFYCINHYFCFACGHFMATRKIGFKAGRLLRNHMRQKILDKIHQVGPATINNKPAGSWASLMLEQVENLHNFYARFLPQQSLSAIVPMVILIAVFPLNWAAGLILMVTAPLVPIFMILVGIAAADSSQKYGNPFSLACTILGSLTRF